MANHHGFKDACGQEWVQALQPKAFVINGWDSAHPTMISLDNMLSQELYAGPRLVLSTATKPEAGIAIRRMDEMASRNGHMIFRVPPGGNSFEIFVKDSSVPDGGVIAHFGGVRVHKEMAIFFCFAGHIETGRPGTSDPAVFEETV